MKIIVNGEERTLKKVVKLNVMTKTGIKCTGTFNCPNIIVTK